LEKVAVFLKGSLYYAPLQLCRESPNVAPNTYWLCSDNLLAYKALEKWDPAISTAIKNKLKEHATTYNLPKDANGLPISYKHEAVIGDIIPLPFNSTYIYTLYSNGHQLKTEIANSSARAKNWENYTDLLLYASLSKNNQGNESGAIHYFDKAKALWNGLGLNDTSFQTSGKYETYKLALLLYVSKVLSKPLSFERQLSDKIWACQVENTGGVRTDYFPNGTALGDTNTETNSLILLAEPSEPVTGYTPPSLAPFNFTVLIILIAGIFITLAILKVMKKMRYSRTWKSCILKIGCGMGSQL